VLPTTRTLLLVMLCGTLPAGLLLAQPASHPDERPQGVELAASEIGVPIRMESGRPVVEATIEGKGPYSFILDTGAGGTVLSSELVKALGLPIVGEMQIGDPIHPQGITAKQVRIGRLVIAGATFSGLIATSMEKSGFSEHLGVRGVLGMPLFSDLLLTLDCGHSEIRIARGELPEPDGKGILALQPGHGIRVPITVGNLDLVADLDSGSPAGISLPNRYMDELPLDGKPVEIGRARTVTSEFAVYGATLRGSVRLAGYRLEKPALRFNGLPFPNIGSEVLKRFAVTIDQKTRRVQFRENPPAPPQA
jgi:aspartyl protease